MSEYDRNKHYSKKKFHSTRESTNPMGRSIFNSKSETSTSSKSKESFSNEPPKKQPTILIKAREPVREDVTSSPKRNQKEEASASASTSKEHEASAHVLKNMVKSMKLVEDGVICTESLQDFVQENNEFLVVGVVGPHGVGKSTILNLLLHNDLPEDLKKSIFKQYPRNPDDEFDCDVKDLSENLDKMDLKKVGSAKKVVFKIQSREDTEDSCHTTQGIDIFITANRFILLDCQPFASVSVLEDLIKHENKRTSLVSEFIPLENSGEIQGLQLTAFLMSVCHVLLVVQDWFFDSNVVRFIQSAEMLKPTIPNPEDELTDHFPHLLLIHNRAQMEDFSPSRFKAMQQIYKKLFHKSKLNIKTGMGLGTGRLINHLNTENCGTPINLFLIPEVDIFANTIYHGHPPLEDLIRKLRANILGATRNPLTHVQLTEKTWLIYCTKVWETVKKSSFFVEYMKLMP